MAILGGAFDPVHLGHMLMAVEAREQLGLHEVRLTPTGSPPHRAAPLRFSVELREALVAAAIAGQPGLTLWRVELERPGPSYTVDTLALLAAEAPRAERWLLLGADQLASLPSWREPERIAGMARIAVAPRPGTPREAADAAARSVPGARVDWLDMPEMGVSATDIRRRMETGRSLRYLVPDPVREMLAARV